MIEINNYHKKSMKIEEKYAEELLFFYGILLNELNQLKASTRKEIDEEIFVWRKKYIEEITKLSKKQVEETKKYANKVLPPFDETKKEKQEDIAQYTKANDDMLNVTTEFIQQKFNELVILERNYDYSAELSTLFIQQVAQSVNDKVELFSTMSTIQNLRTFIFDNAESNNYMQYKWRTQRDNRVRPSHAENDNKWFDIDIPPPITGHVGHDYNCRCYSIAFR